MSQALLDAAKIILGEASLAVLETHALRGDETLVVDARRVHDALRLLRDDARTQLTFLIDLTAVDYLGREPNYTLDGDLLVARYEVVYHLRTMDKTTGAGSRLRVKAPLADPSLEDEGAGKNPSLPSVCPLWKVANWFEREVWDMYGIKFEGHPDLRRILMYEEFVGHPLRKDYPKEKRQPLVRRDPSEM